MGPLPLALVGGGREDPTRGSSRVGGCWLRGLGVLVGILAYFRGVRGVRGGIGRVFSRAITPLARLSARRSRREAVATLQRNWSTVSQSPG